MINSASPYNAEFRQQENGGHMLFYTTDAGGLTERVRITSGGNVGIGTNNPASILHTVAFGSKTATYSGNLLTNTATSSTNAITKYGTEITSTGSWTGTSAVNAGLHVNATGGTINYSAIFDGGNVGINTAAPSYRLHVVANGQSESALAAEATGAYCASCLSYAGTFLAQQNDNNIGIKSSALMVNAGHVPLNNYGGDFIAQDASANNIAVRGVTSFVNGTPGASYNWGGYFSGLDGYVNYGVHGDATSSQYDNYGGHFVASGASNKNYGVWATGGSSCTPSSCLGAAGYFSGLIYSTGNLVVSDGFLKDNISPINNALNVIGQLSPKTYTFKTQDYPSMHLEGGTHFGLIAEDVEQVLPELTRPLSEPEVKDANGNTVHSQIDFKALNYTELIPLLIAGMQEQQEQIDALTQQRNAGSSSPNSGTIELEDMATLQLLQNDPNPFSESTMIRWNIPDEFQNAVVYFYDNNGNQINTYKVNAKGAGELQIFGSRLSSGVYTYTLVVDGKMIDSKKMMKSK